MKLVEALRIANAPSSESGARLNVLLATGFTPLHLQTFLAAHLRMAAPNHGVNLEIGLFGVRYCADGLASGGIHDGERRTICAVRPGAIDE